MNPLVKKIDIHTHMFGADEDVQNRILADKYIGISQCVLLAGTEDMRMGNRPPFLSEDACALAAKYPEHFAWFCNLIPDGTEETYRKLRKYKEMGAVGMGEFGCRLRMDDPKMEHLFSCLEELELPFLFHMAPADQPPFYGMVDDPRMPGLEAVLRNHPRLIVIGHSQCFWFELSKTGETDPNKRNSYPTGKVTEGRVPELMRKYPNLYCDLSAGSGQNALLRDTEYAIKFMEEFQDRLMFGTDWLYQEGGHFPFALATWLDYLCHTGTLSYEAYKKVSRENAERLFFHK